MENFDIIMTEAQYLPSVEYFAKIMKFPKILIEQHEHFVKSSYRNRCYIAGPNGALRLSIPLKKGKSQHTVMKDVEISYDFNWQKIHWQSLCSVYRTSPYFEYYEEKFAPIYATATKYLIDFNLKLMELLLNILEIEKIIIRTEKYEKLPPANVLDYRSRIFPSKENNFSSPEYQQVFQNKTGFLKNMSVVDLLFCEGNDALDKMING